MNASLEVRYPSNWIFLHFLRKKQSELRSLATQIYNISRQDVLRTSLRDFRCIRGPDFFYQKLVFGRFTAEISSAALVAATTWGNYYII